MATAPIVNPAYPLVDAQGQTINPADIERQKRLVQLLQDRAEAPAPQGQMISGHYVGPGLEALMPLVNALAYRKQAKVLDAKTTALSAAQVKARQAAVSSFGDTLKTDPQAAALQAIGSADPTLNAIGQAGLTERVKPQIKDVNNQLVDVGTTGQPKVLGNYGTTFDKPIEVADPSPGQELYQKDSQGKLVPLDKSPKTSISVNTKGEGKFWETLGEGNAKKVLASQDDALRGYETKSTVNQLRNLEKSGVYSGPTANAAAGLATFAQTLGIPVDTTKAANTQQYQQEMAANIAKYLVAGGGVGRSLSEGDRQALERSIPSLLVTPEGRQQIYTRMEAEAQRAIDRHESVRSQVEAARKSGAPILDLNVVDQNPGLGSTLPPGAPSSPSAVIPPPSTITKWGAQ